MNALPNGNASWTKGAVWAVTVGLGLLVALFGVLYQADVDADHEQQKRIEKLEGLVSGIATSIATLVEHTSRHEAAADYWHQTVEKNRENITALQTDVASRPDPFTGTEGLDLERRIYGLEHAVVTVKALNKGFKRVSNTVDLMSNYFESEVYPVLEQIQAQLQQGLEK